MTRIGPLCQGVVSRVPTEEVLKDALMGFSTWV